MKLILYVISIISIGCTHMPFQPDKSLSHLNYLIDVDNPEALKFAQQNNETIDRRLLSDPRYKTTYQEILAILSNQKKLPQFKIVGESVYNFWQDNIHIKGILRKTSIIEFNKNTPHWTTVLDIDLLSKTENMNWVYSGMKCLMPDNEHCLIQLSNGGKDATVTREFNLKDMKFVPQGFYISESKTYATWVDKNHLLVSDGTNPETLTKAGFATQIKLLSRGSDLKKASILFEGEKNSMGVFATSDFRENKYFSYINHIVTYSNTENYSYNVSQNKIEKFQYQSLLNLKGSIKINLYSQPAKSTSITLLAVYFHYPPEV